MKKILKLMKEKWIINFQVKTKINKITLLTIINLRKKVKIVKILKQKSKINKNNIYKKIMKMILMLVKKNNKIKTSFKNKINLKKKI